MTEEEKPSIKYRIKSYQYEGSQSQMVFTIEELGFKGELRKYAREITENQGWQQAFSDDDVAKINFVVGENS